MAYRVLSQDLMTGRYKPGQAVSLRPLAARLGTSPMPVREAVSRLIAERALVLLPNRNVIVPLMTKKRLIELSRARQLLEGAAAHSACGHVTPSLLNKLERLNDQLKQCLLNQQIRPALSHNLNFHFALYHASEEEVVLPLIEMLWRQAGPFVALTPKMPGVKWTAEFHDQILAALKTQDARAVKRAVEQDIEGTTQELLRNAQFI
jgi:DNA-binding GntR family transcriptional regulator